MKDFGERSIWFILLVLPILISITSMPATLPLAIIAAVCVVIILTLYYSNLVSWALAKKIIRTFFIVPIIFIVYIYYMGDFDSGEKNISTLGTILLTVIVTAYSFK